jgi:hypothetical protein
MHCKHCGFANGDDDHRCLRCGRRLSGVVIAAPPGYSGANALAINNDTEEFLPLEPPSAAPPEHPTLFTTYSQTAGASQNVIPFDRLQREAANRAGVKFQPQPPAPQVTPPVTAQHSTGHQGPVQRKKLSHEAQGTLDFIPGVPSKGRKLKTNVDAQVFCDQPVATPTHRFVASAIDGAMIMIGFGLLVVTFQLMGGSFGSGKLLWIRMAGRHVLRIDLADRRKGNCRDARYRPSAHHL